MKKKLFLLAMVLASLSIAGAGTLAYFTDGAVARNVITSGKVDISIEEWQRQEDGTLVPYPGNSVPVMPASRVSKVITVRNHDAENYIRAMVTLTVMDRNGKPVTTEGDEIRLAINTTDWSQKEGEPWWYYRYGVAPRESTAPLVTAVIFDGTGMDDRYQNCTVQVQVNAQAVQTANNDAGPLKAAGWPEA